MPSRFHLVSLARSLVPIKFVENVVRIALAFGEIVYSPADLTLRDFALWLASSFRSAGLPTCGAVLGCCVAMYWTLYCLGTCVVWSAK
jgi:hypothetical protein